MMPESHKNIPRTPAEMSELREQIMVDTGHQTLEKAYAMNVKIDRAKKLASMFNTDEFKWFWYQIVEEMEELTFKSPRDFTGGPFEKLEQLAIVQGGLQLIDSQKFQKELIEDLATKPLIDTSLLESKLAKDN